MLSPAKQIAVCVMSLAVVACEPRAGTAVIGYAYQPFPASDATLRAARDAVAETAGSHHPDLIVQILALDSTPPFYSAIELAERLTAIPEVVVVVGHSSSRTSLAAAPVYNAAGIPQINAHATSRLLADVGPWTFSLPPDDSTEGAFIAQFAADELSARNVSIFYENDEYGTGLRAGTQAGFQELGVTVLDQVPFDSESNFDVLLRASLRRGIPDVLVVAGRQVATARIALLARELSPETRLIAGDGALVLPELADLAGPAADSLYVVSSWVPGGADSASLDFVERFRRVNGRVPLAYEALGYDAIMTAVAAIRDVGPHRRRIQRWLLDLGDVRPAIDGVTGRIEFQDRNTPRLVMARIEGAHAVPAVAR